MFARSLAAGKTLVILKRITRCSIVKCSVYLARPGSTTQHSIKYSFQLIRRHLHPRSHRNYSVATMNDQTLHFPKVELLQGEADRYEGILIDADALPDDPQEFSDRLDHSLLVHTPLPQSEGTVKIEVSSSDIFVHKNLQQASYSVQAWQEEERKGIWLKVPISKVALVEIAVRKGFKFHHAEPDYIQLTRWLPATQSKLPANASHQACTSPSAF